MILDILTGKIKSAYLHFLDGDGHINTAHMPIKKIATKTALVSGKENVQIIVRDVNALAYFDVDVATPTAFDTLVSDGRVQILNDGKAV